jgi:hypothetical protein
VSAWGRSKHARPLIMAIWFKMQLTPALPDRMQKMILVF